MNKRKIANAARAAYEKAVKDKKDQAELDRLKVDWDTKEAAALTEENADDGQGAGAGAGAAGGQPGAAAGAAGGATKELTMDEVEASVCKSVKKALTELLPPNQAATLTEEGVKAIVDAAFAKQFPKDAAGAVPKFTAEGIDKVVETILADQVRKFVRESKMLFGGDADPSTGARNQIEIPYGLSKASLPLHMKQLMNVLMKKHQNDGIEKRDLEQGQKLADQMYLGLKTQGAKALTTSGTGSGAEWMPRDLSSELHRRLYLDSDLAQMFLAQEVQMPTDPYDYPLLTTDPVFYLNNVQNTDATASDPGTAKITLTTARLMALVQYSYEADEDSIVPILPTLQFQLGRAAARALENAIINGDTTATHMDSDVTDPKDQRKAWMGLRKLALAVATLKADLSTGGLNRANLTALLRLLGKWGARNNDLVWLLGVNGWTSLLALDEFALAYYRGTPGTFSGGGALTSPYGGTVVRSEMTREDLNAAGVYDGVTTTKGSALVFNKFGFILGSRREFTIETAKNIRSQTNDIVASFRKAFQAAEAPSATIKTVAVGYNY